MRIRTCAIIVTLALIGFIQVGLAQYRPPVTELQRADSSISGRETIVTTYEAEPGRVENWHTHAGEVVGYVMEGAVRLDQRLQPSVTVAAGRAFIVPAGVPHRTANTASTAAVLVMTYVVEKNKALSAPSFPQD